MLLVGDIGGTNARIAVLEPKSGAAVHRARVPSRDFASLAAALKAALGARRFRFTAACFGVAGPVRRQRCVATNLPWVIDGRALGRALKVPRVRLVNDLVALAYGAVHAPRARLLPLNGARLPARTGASLAIVAAGTGLGQAALIWDDEHRRYVPLGTEGGHGDWAPRDALEEELRGFLAARHGRVSTERVVSGPGLKALYEFFRDEKRVGPGELPRPGHDFSAEVTRLALEERCPCARAAVDLFVRAFGAEVGNVALRYLAYGGAFIAGNIALVLRQRLQSAAFRDALVSKGRFAPLLEKLPVALVTDTDLGLHGAARLARKGTS